MSTTVLIEATKRIANQSHVVLIQTTLAFVITQIDFVNPPTNVLPLINYVMVELIVKMVQTKVYSVKKSYVIIIPNVPTSVITHLRVLFARVPCICICNRTGKIAPWNMPVTTGPHVLNPVSLMAKDTNVAAYQTILYNMMDSVVKAIIRTPRM